ncbi:MAG: DUF4252 domain-containing protein [Bacteroides sp.]|nr:DUF4252 domain-containing protein [Bacteroides sp.]MBD5363078.1 DUF4252 domain-containing protein [Bacteroides sp.]
MKKIILTMLLAMLTSVGAFAQTKFYETCREIPQFETVYIGKSMLQMVNSSTLNIEGINLNSLVGKLESVQVISAEKSKPGKKLKEMADKEFSPAKKYEIMLESHDEGDSTTIYFKKISDKSNEYVLINSSTGDHETTVIILTGSITPEDLKNLRGL